MATTVTTSEYRAKLRDWHERARLGEDLIVTDKGSPSVRVTAAIEEDALARLVREGLLRPARGSRASADLVSIRAPGDSTPAVSTDREQ